MSRLTEGVGDHKIVDDARVAPSAPNGAQLDLYWIPLGAETPVVAMSGRIYEALHALAHRRPRCDLYHSALIAHIDETTTIIESAPVPDDRGRTERGVVVEGAVGSRTLGRFRIFRYEVRRWTGGTIPDLHHAVNSPIRITKDANAIHNLLDVTAAVPAPVWGRDESATGDMWNSNSIISWALARAGLLANAGTPPPQGRAPGWDAGIALAKDTTSPTRFLNEPSD